MNSNLSELRTLLIEAIDKAKNYLDDDNINYFIEDILLVELNDVLLGVNKSNLRLISKKLPCYTILKDDYNNYTELLGAVAKVQTKLNTLDSEITVIGNKNKKDNIVAILLGFFGLGFAVSFASAVMTSSVVSYVLSGVAFAGVATSYIFFKRFLKEKNGVLYPNLDICDGEIELNNDDTVRITYPNGYSIVLIYNDMVELYTIEVYNSDTVIESRKLDKKYLIENELQQVIDIYSKKDKE